METFLRILAVLLLVIANGFFVTSEFAIVSVRRMSIATRAEAGERRARRLLAFKDNLGAYISATQLGVTLSSLGLGWLGESTLADLLAPPFEQLAAGLPSRYGEYFAVGVRHIVASVIAFILITFFHIVLGEQVPKMLGIERSERVALFTVGPMFWFSRVFRGPIRLLDWAASAATRALGLHGSSEHASIYTEEEIRQLVNISHKSGHLEEEERRLINRVFDFSEAEVREAMIPRTEVQALPLTATLEECEHAFCDFGYSRLPVYGDRLDDIAGVLFMKDLMPCLRTLEPTTFNIEQMLHPALFVPATARLGSVLAQMQSEKTHIACVVDEHGGLEGIVTLEDLLEEIVGEINDEYDEETKSQIVEEPNGTFLLDGMLAVRDANRRFKLKLPEEAGYTTMAGFLLARAGRILRPDETVEHEGGLFLVEQVEGRRIRRIRYTPPPTPTEEPEEQEAA
ncbi:MAG: magnesium and cobalt exporter, family [Acidobacteriota bacterium]|jgi:CBS domain containing-hemolysin-like protein|nr:magnesium and cobalt exporter, family [Acidobacteriota bacterium]